MEEKPVTGACGASTRRAGSCSASLEEDKAEAGAPSSYRPSDVRTPQTTLLRPLPGPHFTDGEIQAVEVQVTFLASPAL